MALLCFHGNTPCSRTIASPIHSEAVVFADFGQQPATAPPLPALTALISSGATGHATAIPRLPVVPIDPSPSLVPVRQA